MRRARSFLLVASSVFLLVGAYAWRMPSPQELLHRRAALVVLSNSSYEAVPRVENAQGVADISLPIRVFSGTGTATQSITVNVDNSDGKVDRLWLQVHEPSYKYGDGSRASEGLRYGDKSSPAGSPKMWVRVNGGEWVKVDNKTAICARNEVQLEGIGGGFETVRFTIRAAGVRNGANKIDFYFNGTEGFSSGFRVLNFNFLPGGYAGDLTEAAIDAAGAGRVTDNLVYEDFSRWTAPAGYGSAGQISEGKRVYETAPLVEFPGGPAIRASCSDCHASNGRDLKFYNFSNEAIVARSEFHGLSATQANQVAAYIRSLDFPAVGTPWDPPYQPGPTRKIPTMGDCIQGRPLDDLPQHCWAAGAGLGWVLENDEEMFPYLFPNGITQSAVDVDSTLNLRQLPISIELPDWNEWLPREHPKDVWRTDFTSSDVISSYKNLLRTIDGRAEQAKHDGSALKAIEEWGSSFLKFRQTTGQDDYFGGYGRSIAEDKAIADHTLGLGQWFVVKQWEIMTSYGLEDMAPLMYKYGEKRSWVGEYRSVFDVAPHILATGMLSRTWPHGSALQWTYFTTSWYQLQLILNAGNRAGISLRPVDWKYQFKFLHGPWSKEEPYRYLASYVKLLQQDNNENGVDDGDLKGWYWRHITPTWFFGDAPSKHRPLQSLGYPLEGRVLTPVMQTWIKKTMRHPPSDWTYREDGSMSGVTSASYQPTPYTGGKWWPGAYYADYLYRVIPALDGLGVTKSTLDSMAAWGAMMWPKGDWNSLVDHSDDSGAGGTIRVKAFASPINHAAYSLGEAITFSGTTTDDGSIVRMEGWADGNKLCEDETVPFSCTWTPQVALSYRCSIKFTDRQGNTISSELRSFDVLPKGVSVSHLTLTPGWNVVSLSTVPADTSIRAILSPVLADIVIVKDADGRVFSPEQGIAQLEFWSPGKAYMVYAKRELTLSIPGKALASQQMSVSLQKGWNWVPYLRSWDMDIEEALSSISSALVLATNSEGDVYYPASNINGIGMMYPGQGYKIFVERPCTLIYPANESYTSAIAAKRRVAQGNAGGAVRVDVNG
ncbi:MAG TPA: Ig-like domain-containing protein [Rhodothermales bacterium]|nr:Ig-like domain-containing protein [Rhodothermales bacterium]